MGTLNSAMLLCYVSILINSASCSKQLVTLNSSLLEQIAKFRLRFDKFQVSFFFRTAAGVKWNNTNSVSTRKKILTRWSTIYQQIERNKRQVELISSPRNYAFKNQICLAIASWGLRFQCWRAVATFALFIVKQSTTEQFFSLTLTPKWYYFI